MAVFIFLCIISMIVAAIACLIPPVRRYGFFKITSLILALSGSAVIAAEGLYKPYPNYSIIRPLECILNGNPHCGRYARVDSTKILFRELGNALKLYKQNCGSYPSAAQGLQALVESPTTPPLCEKWGPRYYRHVPLDPWGYPIIYDVVDGKPRLTSFASDGKRGGTEHAMDIEASIE